MRMIDRASMVALCACLSACNDETAWETDGEEDVPASCEAIESTPPIDNLRPSARILAGPPGWRFEPLLGTEQGLLVGITHFSPGHAGRLERWIEGEPTPQFLAELPPSRRVLAMAPGPDAIYLLTIETSSTVAGEVERAVLVVHDGVAEVLLARDDLRASPPLLRSDDAVFAQIESGELLRIPTDGGPAVVFSPACERATLGDDALFLLRLVDDADDGLPRFRVDRQDLKTGAIEAFSQPFCMYDEEPADDPSAILLHGGAPWINTRATIATVGAEGVRQDLVRLPVTRLRGLRSDDALYFWSGQISDAEALFYRLPTSEGPFEVFARLPTMGQFDVNGWGITSTAHYFALNHPAGGEIWRVER